MSASLPDSTIIARVKEASAKLQECAGKLSQALKGKHKMMELVLAAAVSSGQNKRVVNGREVYVGGGHIEFKGLKGTGKTTISKEFSAVLGLTYIRIQSTPDLMPMDVIGMEIRGENGKLEFAPGPLLRAQVVHIDEFNRASAKTAAAYLEVMGENHVTATNGERWETPYPYFILGTRNPRSDVGTSDVPEAMFDRYVISLDVDDPSFDDEMEIARQNVNREGELEAVYEADQESLDSTMPHKFNGRSSAKTKTSVLEKGELVKFIHLSRELPISPELDEAIVTFVRSLRPDGDMADPAVKDKVETGTSGQRTREALQAMVRGLALVRGDEAPGLEHLAAVAYATTGHRIIFKSFKDTQKGQDKKFIENVLDKVLA